MDACRHLAGAPTLGSRTQPPPETCLSTVGQPQSALVGFVRGVAAIVVENCAQRAKLKKIVRGVPVCLGVTAGEYGIEEGPPDQGCRQQTTVGLCRLHERGQQDVIAAVELSGSLHDQLLREYRFLEREEQLSRRGYMRTGFRILTSACAECAALVCGQYRLQRPVRVNPRCPPIELPADLNLPISVAQEPVSSIE